MADEEITDKYRCGYCWNIFGDMTDPRRLPCNHVFCITCIRGDFESREQSLECPNCTAQYDTLDFDALPKAHQRPTYVCTRRGCQKSDKPPKEAVSYCIDCEAKMCFQHFQAHETYYEGEEHFTVPTELYALSPSTYIKQMCKVHDKEKLSMGCKTCYEVVCQECDHTMETCIDGGKHAFVPWKQLNDTVDTFYKKMIHEADERAAAVRQMIKAAWKQLDDDAEIRVKLIREAEEERDEVIRKAQEKFDLLQKKIWDGQKSSTIKVEKYCTELTEKSEELDPFRSRTRMLVKNVYVAFKITQMQRISQECNEMLAKEPQPLLLEKCKMPSADDFMDLDKISLKAGYQQVSRRTCYDVEMNPETGDIYFAGNRRIDICDSNGKIKRTIPSNEGDFTSVQLYKGKLYTLLKDPKGSNKRRAVVFDNSTYKELLRWSLPDYGFVSMLAVNNDKVYVVDSNAKKVKVYALTGKLITDFHHAAFRNPVYLARCQPNHILLADWSAGTVYRIDCKTDVVDAESTFKVPMARGVYCDGNNNVWVWSSKEKVFYVRSLSGQTTKQIPNKELADAGIEFICGFVMVGSSLWGAACGKGVVGVEIDIASET